MRQALQDHSGAVHMSCTPVAVMMFKGEFQASHLHGETLGLVALLMPTFQLAWHCPSGRSTLFFFAYIALASTIVPQNT